MLWIPLEVSPKPAAMIQIPWPRQTPGEKEPLVGSVSWWSRFQLGTLSVGYAAVKHPVLVAFFLYCFFPVSPKVCNAATTNSSKQLPQSSVNRSGK